MERSLFSRRSFLALTTGALAASKALAHAKPLENQQPLRKVLLIGDINKAIFQKKLESYMSSRAVIVTPEENCGNSVDVLGRMEKWIKQYEPDVVLISTGFEDCRTMYYGSYENLVPAKFYARNVKAILQTIFIFSTKNAIPLWITSPFINDERQVASKAKERDFSIFNDDILLYNTAAMKVCHKEKVPTVDVFNLMASGNPDGMLEADGYRLNQKGADQVAKFIADQVGNYI